MIRSGEGQNPPEAEGSVQDTPGPTSLESSRGGRSRSRSGSSSGKRDRDRSRDRSRSRTPGSGRSRRARGQLKTEVVDDPSGSHGGADRQVSAPDGNRVVVPGLGAEAAADLAAAAAARGGADQSEGPAPVVQASGAVQPDPATDGTVSNDGRSTAEEVQDQDRVSGDVSVGDGAEAAGQDQVSDPVDSVVNMHTEGFQFEDCDSSGKPVMGDGETQLSFDERYNTYLGDQGPFPRTDNWGPNGMPPGGESGGGWGAGAPKPAGYASGGWGRQGGWGQGPNRPWGKGHFRPQFYEADGSRKEGAYEAAFERSAAVGVDPRTRGRRKTGGVRYGVKPYDGRPDVIDSSTDSYVSSDESERATDRRSRKIYERRVSFENETDADSVSPSSINKHAETALAKQAATMPKLEKTMLKDIKTSAPRTLQAFVTFMESQRTDPELWFSTLVANLPQGTVLTSELAQINKQAVSYWVRYKQLKELILSTYEDPSAARKERDFLKSLKMSANHGPKEYWTRLASQFEVCINTSKCDVTTQTLSDVFIAGIPSKIRESIIMKGGPPIASNKLSMRTFVSECHKLFIVMKKNSMPTNSPSGSSSLAATGVSIPTNLEGVSSEVLAAELASRRGGAAALAAFGFRAGNQIPKFEGDRTALLRELRTKYSSKLWAEREKLIKANVKLDDGHDKYFEHDKTSNGDFVCTFCWKLKHSASRCKTASPKGGGKQKRRKGKGQ
jgi:hypothetical protein